MPMQYESKWQSNALRESILIKKMHFESPQSALTNETMGSRGEGQCTSLSCKIFFRLKHFKMVGTCLYSSFLTETQRKTH